MKRPFALLVALALTAVAAAPAAAQGVTAEQRLAAIAATEHVDPGWFAATFLAQVPATQVDAILARTHAVTGAFERVTTGGEGAYALRYARATEVAFVQLDGAGKVASLLLWPPQALPAAGAADPGRARVAEILSAARLDARWFAPGTLAQLPLARLQEIVDGFKARLGGYVGLDGGDGVYLARMAKGTLRVAIHLDSGGAVDALRFLAPHVVAGSLDDGLRALARLPGRVAYVVDGPSGEIFARDAGAPLAVGSAFKLAVLDAIADRVRAGALRWDQPIALRAAWISLPTGDLRELPLGTSLPLATYAGKMIAISDNTAADALVALAGPAALAPYAGANVPFLTTRAFFVLKGAANADLLARWRASADPASRAAVIAATERRPLPPVADFLGAPRDLDVEWLFSVRALCAMLARVADLPAFAPNPGVADRSAFRSVAYKGGSEPGVMNMTTRVVTKAGSSYCFSATENDAAEPLDETAFELAYAEALTALAAR